MAKLEFNTEFYGPQTEDALRFIDLSMQRGLPSVEMKKPHGRGMAIVGAGPSLEETHEKLRGKDWYIMTANAAHDYLIGKGIEPDGWSYIEVDKWDEPICDLPSKKCEYFIASQCAPQIFEHLEGRKVTLWHLWQDIGEAEVLRKYISNPMLVGGGSTPTLRAINLGMVLGYRHFELFGVDSCYTDKSHANMPDNAQRKEWANDGDIEVTCAGRTFRTKPYLARQAYDFDKFFRRYHHTFTMNVHGDGLIPHIYKTLMETASVQH